MNQGDKGTAGAFERDDTGDILSPTPAPEGGDQNLYLKVPMPPPRILLLDDDITIRQTFSEDFTAWGFVSDCVATTSEAKSLLTTARPYNVIFVDIKLRDGDMSGDAFILENRKLMGNAKVAAITAEFFFQDMEHERYADLIQANIEIIPKRKNFKAKLIETIESVVAEEKQRMLLKIENFLGGAPENAPIPLKAPARPTGLPHGFVMMLEQILLDWLKSREQPDKKRILHGGELYSYNDIASEIEGGTELGQVHLKMMASLFMRTMSIDS
jgi:CheY-like chemotaxis protein